MTFTSIEEFRSAVLELSSLCEKTHPNLVAKLFAMQVLSDANHPLFDVLSNQKKDKLNWAFATSGNLAHLIETSLNTRFCAVELRLVNAAWSSVERVASLLPHFLNLYAIHPGTNALALEDIQRRFSAACNKLVPRPIFQLDTYGDARPRILEQDTRDYFEARVEEIVKECIDPAIGEIARRVDSIKSKENTLLDKTRLTLSDVDEMLGIRGRRHTRLSSIADQLSCFELLVRAYHHFCFRTGAGLPSATGCPFAPVECYIAILTGEPGTSLVL